MTVLNKKGFSIVLLLILTVLLSAAGIIGGLLYFRLQQAKNPTPSTIPVIISPQPSVSGGGTRGGIKPYPASSSANSINPTNRYGPCPSGYVQYGVPLGCVKPEVIEKCKNQYGGCPICLASTTMIDSPTGEINVKDLKVGMEVWSVNKLGQKIAARLLQVSSMTAPKDHQVIDLILTDGRELFVSPGHPAINGLPIADLTVGEIYDNSKVVSKNLIPYWDNKTYDLLPAGETGFYYADKILVGSTLKH